MLGLDAVELEIQILEDILLSPAHNIYLMVGTSIRYQVLKGLTTELSMPCDEYELHLEDSVVNTNGNPDVAVARLDQRTSTVTAIQLGHINVVLHQKSLRMQEVFRHTDRTLFVVEPASLGFKIHPGSNWVLEIGRDYDILIEVLDKSGNKLYLSDVVVKSATNTAAKAQQALPVEIGKLIEVFLTTRGQGANLIGTCSSFQTEAIAQLQPEISVACHLSFTDYDVDVPASSVFKTHISFDTSSGLYTCSVTLQPKAALLTRVCSMSMSNLLVKAALEGSAFSGKQVSATAGMYSDLTELTLSNLRPTAELIVFVPAAAQADMEVVTSSPLISVQKAEAQCDSPSLSKYTIGALDLRAAGSASVTFSSASLGQSLIIPVTLIHVADSDADL